MCRSGHVVFVFNHCVNGSAFSFAVPARCLDVHTFKPNSTVVDQKYDVKMYERTVSVSQVIMLHVLCFPLTLNKITGRSRQQSTTHFRARALGIGLLSRLATVHG